MAAGGASWDVPEVAVLQRAADDDSDHSHPEEDSVEELGVQDPVSVWPNVDSVLPFSIRK